MRFTWELRKQEIRCKTFTLGFCEGNDYENIWKSERMSQKGCGPRSSSKVAVRHNAHAFEGSNSETTIVVEHGPLDGC